MRGFGGGNMGGLMAQAQKMQAKLAKVQEKLLRWRSKAKPVTGL